MDTNTPKGPERQLEGVDAPLALPRPDEITEDVKKKTTTLLCGNKAIDQMDFPKNSAGAALKDQLISWEGSIYDGDPTPICMFYKGCVADLLAIMTGLEDVLQDPITPDQQKMVVHIAFTLMEAKDNTKRKRLTAEEISAFRAAIRGYLESIAA